MNVVSFPYPDVLLDEGGYPTQEALDFIKNWTIVSPTEEEKSIEFGQFFGKQETYKDLILYLKLIWYYPEGIVYEDGLLEIHTIGWSGNEDIVRELKNTCLWMFKHRATRTGGHYYFRIDNNSTHTYDVKKIPINE